MRNRPPRTLLLLVAAAAVSGCVASRPASSYVSSGPRESAAPIAESRPAAASPFTALLERYDRDHDGRIVRAEYDRTDSAFANLDRDRDGAITAKDFEIPVEMPPDLAAPFIVVRRFAGAEAGSIAIGDLDEAFEAADQNHDGSIDREEFTGGHTSPGPDRFAPLLAVADLDHDSRVSLEELKSWATRRDLDADGRISVRERMMAGREPKTGWFEPADRAPAPDFDLPLEEGPGSVRLSSFAKQKPVVLIFGSFT